MDAMDGQVTRHLVRRLSGRVSPDQVPTIERAVESTLSACKRDGVTDAAVRVWRDTVKHRAADGSNGQCAVLVLRGGAAVTLFWRRVTQPHNRAAYATAEHPGGVERVLCVRGTCNSQEHKEHR